MTTGRINQVTVRFTCADEGSPQPARRIKRLLAFVTNFLVASVALGQWALALDDRASSPQQPDLSLPFSHVPDQLDEFRELTSRT